MKLFIISKAINTIPIKSLPIFFKELRNIVKLIWNHERIAKTMMTKRNNVRIVISNLMYNRVIVIAPNQVCKRIEQYQRHKHVHT